MLYFAYTFQWKHHHMRMSQTAFHSFADPHLPKDNLPLYNALTLLYCYFVIPANDTLLILKADRPHTYMPPDYRQTDKHLR